MEWTNILNNVDYNQQDENLSLEKEKWDLKKLWEDVKTLMQISVWNLYRADEDIKWNMGKLKDKKAVIFTSAWWKKEVFADINYMDDNIIITHEDLKVIFNSKDQTIIWYDMTRWFIPGENNWNTYPVKLEYDGIKNLVNMCVNWTLDFKATQY